MNNVYDIPIFWSNLNGLVHASNENIVEACFTRAYCMQSALNFHIWLTNIIQSAMESSSRRSWIERLAYDVQVAVHQKRMVTFDSVEYLPKLKLHKTYSYTPGPFRFDQTEIISTTLSSILRVWLQFPSDELSLLQLSLVDILVSKSPSSVLFLDKVWEMYVTPFATVFNVWKLHSSKKNIEKSLVEFRQQFESHPYATASSLEHRKLEYLSELIAEWLEINGLSSFTPATVSRIIRMFVIVFKYFQNTNQPAAATDVLQIASPTSSIIVSGLWHLKRTFS